MDMISVIIPAYNMCDTIERAVRSVLEQDYSDIEVIVVDDGSNDGTDQILQTIAEQDARLRVLKGNHDGSGVARNLALKNAVGQYVAFMDADDYMPQGSLTVRVRAMDPEKCDLTAGSHTRVYSSGAEKFYKQDDVFYTGEEIRMHFDRVQEWKSVCLSTLLWDKLFSMSVIREHNVEFPSMRRMQDYIFIARYMTFSKGVHFFSDNLYYYKVGTLEDFTKKKPAVMLECTDQLRDYLEETIIAWNPENEAVRNSIDRFCIKTLLNAIRDTYFKKHGYNGVTRMRFAKEVYAHLTSGRYDLKSAYPGNQRILKLFKHGLYVVGVQYLHYRYLCIIHPGIRKLKKKLFP